MGIIQSLYQKVSRTLHDSWNSVVIIASVKICCECNKEIEVHVAREFNGKSSKYYCSWTCYNKRLMPSNETPLLSSSPEHLSFNSENGLETIPLDD